MCRNNDPTVRKLAICIFKNIEAKANLFWDKSAGRRHGFFGIRATQPTVIFDGVWIDGKTSGARGGVWGWRWAPTSLVLHIGGRRRDPWRWFREPPVDGKSVTARGSAATAHGDACLRKWRSNSWVLQIGGQRRDLQRRFRESMEKKLADQKGGSNWWCDGCGFFFFVCTVAC